jgi:hypothetical protein
MVTFFWQQSVVLIGLLKRVNEVVLVNLIGQFLLPQLPSDIADGRQQNRGSREPLLAIDQMKSRVLSRLR